MRLIKRERQLGTDISWHSFRDHLILIVGDRITGYPLCEGFTHEDAQFLLTKKEQAQLYKKFAKSIIDKSYEAERRIYVDPEKFLRNPDCYWEEQQKHHPKDIIDIKRDAREMDTICS